ncbi:hypothetical protein PV325_003561 [Microctonus aethiopoides]|nr:hypothetical protein PV325_003561 [Microctonus aethiopoides]
MVAAASFVYILVLIQHSLGVLNNFENKNENIDDKRTLCVGGDVINGNDAILDPIVVETESVSSVKVNKHTGSIEDRTSSVSTNFELPFSSYNNPLSIYSSETNQPFDLQLPEIFSSSASQSLNSFSQFGNTINTKRLQFGIPYTPAFPPYRNNQMKSLNIHKIPTSLEAYGPPINNPINSYFSSKENHQPPSSIRLQNNIHNDLSSNPGIFAPPTPPDIKYDGWKPIPGHISPPNHLSSSSSSSSSSPHQQSTNDNGISTLSTNNNYAQLPANEIVHSSRQLSEFSTAIPSNSYGEPINNPDDHDLKQSVRQSQISDGLPPPQIPENEPFHVNQGPTTMIFTTNSPSIKNNINDNQHHNILEALTPPYLNSGDNFSGLFRQQSHGQLKHINNNHVKINNNNINNNDLLVSQLPPFHNELFTTFTNGVNEFSNSYLAPPPSSFSSTGPYPSSRRPLYYAEPKRNQFKLINNNRNLPKFIYPRNRGSIRSPMMFPIAPPMANLIPPRTTPLVNFRQPIPSQLSSKLNYNNYPSSSAASAASSEFHDSAIENSFINNYKYSTSFDSHGSPSLNQPELVQVLSSNQPQQLENGNTDEMNEISHDESNYKFEIKVNDDIKSSSDTFSNFQKENNEAAQALAQALVSEDASSDSIQIRGSKDSYTLQIESGNDGEGMENSDGTIKHDQILSEQLLHDIISAIEQPGDGGNVQILSNPPVQSLEETHKQSDILSSSLSQHSMYHYNDNDDDNDDSQQAASELNEKSVDVTAGNNQKNIPISQIKNNAALFFNNHYHESINNIKSTFNNDKYSHGNNTNINS